MSKNPNFYERLNTCEPTYNYMIELLGLVKGNDINELDKFLKGKDLDFIKVFNGLRYGENITLEDPLSINIASKENNLEMFKYLIHKNHPFNHLSIFYIKQMMSKKLHEHIYYLIDNKPELFTEYPNRINSRYKEQYYLLNTMTMLEYKLSNDLFEKLLPLWNKKIIEDFFIMSAKEDNRYFKEIIKIHNFDINDFANKNPDKFFYWLSNNSSTNFSDIVKKLSPNFCFLKNKDNENFFSYFVRVNIEKGLTNVYNNKDFLVNGKVFVEKYKENLFDNLTSFNKTGESVLSIMIKDYLFLMESFLPETQSLNFKLQGFNDVKLNKDNQNVIQCIGHSKRRVEIIISLLELFDCDLYRSENKGYLKMFERIMDSENFNKFESFTQKKELEKQVFLIDKKIKKRL